MTKYGDQPNVHVQNSGKIVTRTTVTLETHWDRTAFSMICTEVGIQPYQLARQLVHEAIQARLEANPELSARFRERLDTEGRVMQKSTDRYIAEKRANEQANERAKKARSKLRIIPGG